MAVLKRMCLSFVPKELNLKKSFCILRRCFSSWVNVCSGFSFVRNPPTFLRAIIWLPAIALHVLRSHILFSALFPPRIPSSHFTHSVWPASPTSPCLHPHDSGIMAHLSLLHVKSGNPTSAAEVSWDIRTRAGLWSSLFYGSIVSKAPVISRGGHQPSGHYTHPVWPWADS